MGCAETFVMRLPDDYNQAARDALAHRPRTACGPRRSLAVAPLIGDQRCYGEAPMGLRSYEQAAGDAVSSIPPKTANNPVLMCNSLISNEL